MVASVVSENVATDKYDNPGNGVQNLLVRTGGRDKHSNDDDDLDQGDLMEKVFFGVLWSLDRERPITGWRFCYFKLVFEWWQLFGVVVLPYHGWTIKIHEMWWRWLGFWNMTQAFKAQQYFVFLKAFYIINGLVILALLSLIWVGWSFKQRHQNNRWITKLISSFLVLSLEVFGVGMMRLAQVGMECRYVGYSRPMTLSAHPSKSCREMPQVAHVLVSWFMLIIIACTGFLSCLGRVSINPITRSLLASGQSGPDMVSWISKVILTLTPVIFGWRRLQVLVHFFTLMALTGVFLRWVPHLSPHVNCFRVGTYTSCLWASGMAMLYVFHPFVYRKGTQMEDFSRNLTPVMLYGCLVAFCFGYTLAYVRIKWYMDLIEKKFRPEVETNDAMGQTAVNCTVVRKEILDFRSPHDVDIAARCMRKWIQNVELDPEAVKLAETVLQAGLLKFSGDSFMVLVYANFLFEVQDNANAANSQVQGAKKQAHGLVQRYMIFYREQEYLHSSSVRKIGESTLDLASYVEFQRNYKMALRAHRDALASIRTFWQYLMRSNVSFQHMTWSLRQIDLAMTKADKTYRIVLERYPVSTKLLRGYAKFLEVVKIQPTKADKLYTEADKIEAAQAEEREGVDLDGNEEGKDRLLRKVDERVQAVIIINSRGIIQVANKNAYVVLGYSKGELEGKNISVILPPPFSQRHDMYIKRYLMTGEERVINRLNDVVALHKNRYVFPVCSAITKVSGAGEESVFMGVIDKMEETPGTCCVYALQSGSIAAVDLAFIDWFAVSLETIVGQNLSVLVDEPDKLTKVIEELNMMTVPESVEANLGIPSIHVKHFYMASVEVSAALRLVGMGTEVLIKLELRRQASTSDLILSDKTGKIRYVTPDIAHSLRIPPSVLRSMSIHSLIPVPYAALHNQYIKTFTEEGLPPTGPLTCRSGLSLPLGSHPRTQRIVHLQVSLSDDTGEINIKTLVYPSSLEAGLDERRLRLRVAPDGRVLDVLGKTSETLFGFKPSLLQGRNLSEFIDVMRGEDVFDVMLDLLDRTIESPGCSWRVGVSPPVATPTPGDLVANMTSALIISQYLRPAVMTITVESNLNDILSGDQTVLEVCLWRADLVCGVLEVDRYGRIQRSQGHTFLQPQMMFGASFESLQRSNLSEWIEMDSRGIKQFFATSRGGLKVSMNPNEGGKKAGPLLTVSGQHCDLNKLDLYVQAVAKEGIGHVSFITLRFHKPICGPKNFGRLLKQLKAQARSANLLTRALDPTPLRKESESGPFPRAGIKRIKSVTIAETAAVILSPTSRSFGNNSSFTQDASAHAGRVLAVEDSGSATPKALGSPQDSTGTANFGGEFINKIISPRIALHESNSEGSKTSKDQGRGGRNGRGKDKDKDSDRSGDEGGSQRNWGDVALGSPRKPLHLRQRHQKQRDLASGLRTVESESPRVSPLTPPNVSPLPLTSPLAMSSLAPPSPAVKGLRPPLGLYVHAQRRTSLIANCTDRSRGSITGQTSLRSPLLGGSAVNISGYGKLPGQAHDADDDDEDDDDKDDDDDRDEDDDKDEDESAGRDSISVDEGAGAKAVADPTRVNPVQERVWLWVQTGGQIFFTKSPMTPAEYLSKRNVDTEAATVTAGAASTTNEVPRPSNGIRSPNQRENGQGYQDMGSEDWRATDQVVATLDDHDDDDDDEDEDDEGHRLTASGLASIADGNGMPNDDSPVQKPGGGKSGGRDDDQQSEASGISGVSGGSGLSGVSSINQATGSRADFRTLKRYRKLLRVFNQPQVKVVQRNFKISLVWGLLAVLIADLAGFITLEILMEKLEYNLTDLNNAGLAPKLAMRSVIYLKYISSAYSGQYLEAPYADFNLNVLSSSLEATALLLKQQHNDLFLGYGKLRFLSTKHNISSLWRDFDVQENTYFNGLLETTASTLWQTGNTFIDNMFTVAATHPEWVAAYNAASAEAAAYPLISPASAAWGVFDDVEGVMGLSAWDMFRFEIANGPTELCEGYQRNLDALVFFAVDSKRTAINVQIVFLVVEGCLISLAVVFYLYRLVQELEAQRFNVFGCFLSLPASQVRGLATMAINIDEESVIEDGEDDHVDEKKSAAGRSQETGFSDQGGAGGHSAETPGEAKRRHADMQDLDLDAVDLDGDVVDMGHMDINGHGAPEDMGTSSLGNLMTRPAVPQLSRLGSVIDRIRDLNRGMGTHQGGRIKDSLAKFFESSRAVFGRVVEKLSGGASVRAMAAMRNKKRAQRDMNNDGRDGLLLICPFVVWAIVVISVRAASYAKVASTDAYMATIDIINTVLTRNDRLLYYAFETAGSRNLTTKAFFRSRLAEELVLQQLEYSVLLYGANATLRQQTHFEKAAKGVAFMNNRAAHNLLFMTGRSCYVHNETACYEPTHPYYSIVRNGLNYMMQNLFTVLENFIVLPLDAANLNTAEMRYVMTELPSNTEAALEELAKDHVEFVFGIHKDVQMLSSILLVVAWVLCFIFVVGLVRPYLKRGDQEVEAVARLMSQMPPDVEVENIVTRYMLPFKEINRKAKSASTTSADGTPKRKGLGVATSFVIS